MTITVNLNDTSREPGCQYAQVQVLDRPESDSECPNHPLYISRAKDNWDIPVPTPPPLRPLSIAPKDFVENVKGTPRCPYPILVRHRTRKELIKVMSAPCRCWHCPKCRPRLMAKQKKHAAEVLGTIDHCWVSEVDKNAWGTFHRRITRKGGNYMRVEKDDGNYLVIASVPVGIEAPPASAMALVVSAIDAAPGHKPVTTSRGWSLKQNSTPHSSQWKRVVLDIPGTIDDARQVVEELGLVPHSTVTVPPVDGVLDAFEVQLPPSWMDEGDTGFNILLQWLIHGPRSRPHFP